MPIYQFSCRTCGYTEDITCRIADKPETYACPWECGGDMKQDLTPVGIEADNITDTPWLKEFAHAHNRFGGKRARDGGKAIESRTDYKNYLERNDLRPDAPSISTSHD